MNKTTGPNVRRLITVRMVLHLSDRMGPANYGNLARAVVHPTALADVAIAADMWVEETLARFRGVLGITDDEEIAGYILSAAGATPHTEPHNGTNEGD